MRRGLRDLEAGKRSPEALLLLPVTGRLRLLGVPVPALADDIEEPELGLYDELCKLEKGAGHDPYSIDNSWRRQLDSFVANLESRRARDRSRAGA